MLTHARIPRQLPCGATGLAVLVFPAACGRDVG